MTMADSNVGLYFHIPFCASRCAYCDFCSTANRRDLIPRYQAALRKHFQEFAPRLAGRTVDTVYFGGGTPSWYGAKELAALLEDVKRQCKVSGDAEITLEANPDSVSFGALERLRLAGFNRISLGVQSASDEILHTIGRRHSWAQVPKAVEAARQAGFPNVSLDFIYGLPGQTRADWADTLDKAIALNPEHLSCYGLKIEEGTPLWESRNDPDIPDDDTQADMYLYAVDRLAAAGYGQYEISNFARTGFASRHNLKYWQLGDYAGFGASAASNMGYRRYTLLRDVEGYIRAVESGGDPVCESEALTLDERAGEYIMLGLRTAAGIAAEEYERQYRASFAGMEACFVRYARMGLARQTAGRWRFTPQGFLLSNRLIGELLDVQAESGFGERRSAD